MLPDGLIRTPLGHTLVAGDQGVSASVLQYCTFDYPDNLRQLTAVAQFIPEGGVVVDAGACIGDQTCAYARMVGSKGIVYAFEPNPVSFAALIRNTATTWNVLPSPVALGSEDTGVMPLTVIPTNVGASYLGTDLRFDGAFPVETVSVRTMDDALSRLHRLDFIHLDAEGMEAQILKGAETLIKKFHPVLLVEVTDGWLRHYGSSSVALLQQIASYGYLTLIPLQRNSAQFDVVCLPGLMVGVNTPEVSLAGQV